MAVENAGDSATDTGMPEEILVPEGQEGQVKTEAPDVENFARRLGWRPKEEFKPPANRPNAEWMDADAFVERVEKEAPLRNERLRFQDQMLARQDTQIKELNDRIERLAKLQEENNERTKTAEVRGFNRASEELERQMDDAAANGDREAYAQAKRNLQQLHRQFPAEPASKKTEEKKPDPPTQAQQAEDPAIMKFMSENPWAVQKHPSFDEPMYLYGLAMEKQIGTSKPWQSTAERLAEVKDEVRKRFPEKFENQARKGAPTVATPGSQQRARANGAKKTVSDLPDDAKRTLARLKTQIKGYKDEDYLKDYKW